MSNNPLLNEVLKDKELAKLASTLTEEELENNLLELYKQKKFNDVCANCKGNCKQNPEYTEIFLVKDGEYLKQRTRDCKYSKAKLESLFMDSNAYEGKLISNDNRAKIFDEMTKSLEGNKGIYLHGSFGCGKTYLMYKLAENISKTKNVLFVYYPELINTVKATMANNNLSFEGLINRLKKVDVLFLDDIGREQNTVFNRDQVLGTILQYRCMNNLQTFMTSNYDIKMLADHLSDTKDSINLVNSSGIIERIMSLMNVVELKDKSYR